MQEGRGRDGGRVLNLHTGREMVCKKMGVAGGKEECKNE